MELLLKITLPRGMRNVKTVAARYSLKDEIFSKWKITHRFNLNIFKYNYK